MIDPALVSEARNGWVSEIDDFLDSLPELRDTLKRPANGEVLDFCVWLGLPEATSEYALWGSAVRDVLEHFGIRVIVNNNIFYSRQYTEGQLKHADLIVMLVLT